MIFVVASSALVYNVFLLLMILSLFITKLYPKNRTFFKGFIISLGIFILSLTWINTEDIREVNSNKNYDNCSEAFANGDSNIHFEESGYASHLDRDGDGLACER